MVLHISYLTDTIKPTHYVLIVDLIIALLDADLKAEEGGIYILVICQEVSANLS